MVNVCPVCYAWWFWPVMPATWEAEAGSQGQYLNELYSEFKGNLGTLVRPCFKIKGEKRYRRGYCEWRILRVEEVLDLHTRARRKSSEL